MPFVPLLAGLDPVVAALLLTLLVLGIAALFSAMALAFEHISIPLVGRWIAGAFRALTAPVVNVLGVQATAHAPTLESWLRATSYIGTGLANDIKAVFNLQAQLITYLYREAIPAQGKVATGEATRYVNDQVSTLQHAITAARTDLTHLAAADSTAEYQRAEKSVAGVHRELVAMNATAIRTAEHYADKAIAKLSGELAHEIAGLRAKVGAPSATAPATTAPPVAVPQPVAGTDLSTQVGVNTAAIAAVGVAVAALTREFESCAVTSCSGPNNLSSLLSSILGFASLAEIAAFFSDAISDPAGAAVKYGADIQGLVTPFEHAGGDVWGAIEQVLGI